MYISVLALISFLSSSDTLFVLQKNSSPSSSAHTSFGSKRSDTAFLGPSDSVSSTYLGGCILDGEQRAFLIF